MSSSPGAARSAAATAAGVAAGLTALLLAAPRPSAALTELAGAASSDSPTAPVVAVVALLAWGVTAWLALTVAVVLLARLPGLVGGTGRAVATRVAPLAVRRTVEAALGLTVVAGVLVPTAAAAGPVPAPATTGAATPGAAPDGPAGEVSWDLDWPSAGTPVPTTTASTASAAPPTARPGVARPRAAVPPSAPAPVPVVRPVAVAPVAGAGAVVVRPGDSLWSLAEASLRGGRAAPSDRQVAQAWPQWWAANRDVIGDDPDLLLPGTVLRPPPGAAP